MTIKPLGDQAVIVYLPDEAATVRFAKSVQSANPPWLLDVVPAYSSVGVFFDSDQIDIHSVSNWLERSALRRSSSAKGENSRPPKEVEIPVCYERQRDMDRIHERTGLGFDDIISLHLSRDYTVYAIGFVPGFPYLGYLPEELQGMPRLDSPRVRVEPGSVGLTGKQTGIYPLARPGGWNLIGQTPLELVNVAEGYFPLRVGDTVRFRRIDEQEFRELQGERLRH